MRQALATIGRGAYLGKTSSGRKTSCRRRRRPDEVQPTQPHLATCRHVDKVFRQLTRNKNSFPELDRELFHGARAHLSSRERSSRALGCTSRPLIRRGTCSCKRWSTHLRISVMVLSLDDVCETPKHPRHSRGGRNHHCSRLFDGYKRIIDQVEAQDPLLRFAYISAEAGSRSCSRPFIAVAGHMAERAHRGCC
jgi:hypothetical protein